MTQRPLYGVHIDTNADGTFNHSYTGDTQCHAKLSRVLDYNIFDPERSGDVVRPQEATVVLANADGAISATFGTGDRVLIETGVSSTEEFYGEVVSFTRKNGKVYLNCKDMTNRLFRDNLKHNLFDKYNDRKLFDIPASPKKFQDYVPYLFRVNQGATLTSWSFNDAYSLMTAGSWGLSAGHNTQIYDGITMGPSINTGFYDCASFKNNFIWVCPNPGDRYVSKFYMGDMTTTVSKAYSGTFIPVTASRKHNSNSFVIGGGSLVSNEDALYYASAVSTSRTGDSWVGIWSTTATDGYIFKVKFTSDDTTTVACGDRTLFKIEPDNPPSSTNIWPAAAIALNEEEEYQLWDVAWGTSDSGKGYAIVTGMDRNHRWSRTDCARGQLYTKRGCLLKVNTDNSVTVIRDDRLTCLPTDVVSYTNDPISGWSTTRCKVYSRKDIPDGFFQDSSTMIAKPFSTTTDYSFTKEWSSVKSLDNYYYLNFFVAQSSTEDIRFTVHFADSSNNTTVAKQLTARPIVSPSYLNGWGNYQLDLNDIDTPSSTVAGYIFDRTNVNKLVFHVSTTYNGDVTTTDMFVYEVHLSKNLGPYYTVDHNDRDDFFLIGGSRLLKMDGSTEASISTVAHRYYASAKANPNQYYEGPITNITYKHDMSAAMITSVYGDSDTDSFASVLGSYGDVAGSGNLFVDLSGSNDNYIVKPIIAVEDPFYYLDNQPPRSDWIYYSESDSEGPIMRQYIGHRDWQFHEIFLPLARVGCDDPRKDYKFVVGIGKGRPDSVESPLSLAEVDALTLPEFKNGPENTPLFKISLPKYSVDASSLSSTDGLYIYIDMSNSNFSEENHVRLSMSSTYDYFIPENEGVE